MPRQIILDTETTGLYPKQGHRIIEIGCLEMVNRRLTHQNFHYYLNPEREVDEGAVAVHGLTNEFLADKPKFAEIAEALLDFIKGAELVIHNAPFDLGFLNHEFALYSKTSHQKIDPIETFCEVFDTLPLARQKYPGQKNNLDALCKRLKVDNSERDLHGALLDARLLSRVYLLMTGGQGHLFEERSAETTQQILEETATAMAFISPTTELALHYANAEELEQHEAWLQTMKSKNGGKCVWEEN